MKIDVAPASRALSRSSLTTEEESGRAEVEPIALTAGSSNATMGMFPLNWISYSIEKGDRFNCGRSEIKMSSHEGDMDEVEELRSGVALLGPVSGPGHCSGN